MKIVNKLGWIFTFLASAGLLAAFISPYFSPEDYWFLAFFGLAFPFLFVLNIAFALYWLFRRKFRSRAWIPLSVLILCLIRLPLYIQVFQKTTEVKPENVDPTTLTIADFNTHYMGVFDHLDSDTSRFFNILNQINPDIICFQEFTNLGGSYEKPLFRMFFERYGHFENVNADGLSNTFPTGYGVCIFSRYPIIKKGFVEQINQSANLTVFADVLVGSDTVRVVNTHLKSIVFDKEDYKTVEELKNADENVESWQLRRIAAKLRYAFKWRAMQATEIRRQISHCPYPIILCGDFNDSPSSFAYNTLRGNLKDAFLESGYGMSRTYVGKMPSFRIDYILHDSKWKSFNYSTHQLNFSDHKMISCTIKLR